MFTFFQSLLGSFMAPKVMIALAGVLTLILGDFLLGVFLAMKNKAFDVRKLPQFMESSFVPYVGGLLILALFSSTDTALEALFFTIAAAVHLKFLADIKDKLAQLFAGIQLQSPIEVASVQPDPQPASQDTIKAPDPQVKSITDVIQETMDQVGNQAKTQAVNNFTQQLADVVQKAAAPQGTPQANIQSV